MNITKERKETALTLIEQWIDIDESIEMSVTVSTVVNGLVYYSSMFLSSRARIEDSQANLDFLKRAINSLEGPVKITDPDNVKSLIHN